MNTDQITPTPTPRTDALEQTYRDTGSVLPWNAINLARDLERQLAAERALADSLAHWLMAIEIDELVPDAWLPPVTKAIAAWTEARGA